MDLTLGPEQESIREAVRDVLAARLPAGRARAVVAAERGMDLALWREAAGLGWFGLGLPEAVGGAGYGLPEEMILFAELGRSLAPGPWLGPVLAAHGLAGVPALRDELAEVVAGAKAVAVVDDPEDAVGEGSRLTGAAHGVADGGAADLL